MIKSIGRFIRKCLDTFPSSPGLLMPGMWRVHYYEGGKSVRMTYDAACNYADIFGGEVVYCRYEDIPPKFGKDILS